LLLLPLLGACGSDAQESNSPLEAGARTDREPRADATQMDSAALPHADVGSIDDTPRGFDDANREPPRIDDAAADGMADPRPIADAKSDRGAPSADPDARAVDGGRSDASSPPADGGAPFRVLVFSRTAAFRHASIPAAVTALKELQSSGGYLADATEDATAFSVGNLARYQVVVFALTTGDVLNDNQQIAFQGWVNAGGGFVGIHSASDTEYDWAFYGELVGAYFSKHPAVQNATVRIEAPTHPIMAGLTATWPRRDEWYNFATNPRAHVTVLATVDESTYTGGTMGSDHPIVWAHEATSGARAFYTALGHAPEHYAEAPMRRMLVNGIRWAAKR